MSVRVNLLPEQVQASARASTARYAAAGAAALLVAALGGLYFMQAGQVDDAEAELAAVEADNAELQARVTELAPFAALTAERDEAVGAVTAAMDGEASVAGVLQDLSAVLPPQAEITTLTVTMADGAQAPSAGGTRPVQGRLSAQGRALVGIAPGVEDLMLSVDRAAAFDNPFVTTTTVEEGEVAAFTLEVDLGPEVLTDRYELDPQQDVAP